jgi:hypothetical protein
LALGRFAISYSSNSGFGGGFGVYDIIKGKFGLRDPAGISMGRARDTDNPYVRPRSKLSALGDAAARFAAAKVLRQGSRPQAAQIPVSIPQTFAAVGEQKLEPLVKEGTQSMSLDLGGLLGTLGTSYIEARYGGPRAPQIMAPTIRAQGPAAGIAATPVVGPLVAGGLGAIAGEAYDFFTEDQRAQLPGGVQISGNCPPPSYCVDGKTGKVTIKQKRRRRRRLATSSDIRDLSSLKSVLSPADLKMWIATHPS